MAEPSGADEGFGSAPPPPRSRRLSTFAADSRLSFRHAEDPQDIQALARTEDYGDFGQTDLVQVTGWWRRYRHGNLLAVYDGRVVGGVDIWPITESAHHAFKAGALNEAGLGAVDIERDADIPRCFWYVGSVSLDGSFQAPRVRAELLVRLLSTAMVRCRRSVAYPARVLAEAWTRQGRHMLLRHMNFQPVVLPGRSAADTALFEMVLHTDRELDALIDRLSVLLVDGAGPDDPA